MAKHIYLQPNERSELEQMIKSGMHAAQAMGRCRALLLLNRSQGKKRTVKEVCEAAMVNSVTIHNIKQRYFAGGIPSVPKTKEQPGRPTIKMTGEVEAHLIALACSEPPEGHARWTLRLLADRLVELEVVETVSHVTVGETLKKTSLNLGG